MRVGLIARAEPTGLGRMSIDAVRNLPITRCVIVDVDHPSPMHLHRFPKNTPIAKAGTDDFEREVKAMLTHIDTLLVLETPYDPDVYQWAEAAGVMTLCVAMPEYDIPNRWAADIVVNPTDYLHDRLPDHAIIYPWPVDIDTVEYRPRTQVNTWLHVIGRPCANDRNGTDLVVQAFRNLTERRLLIYSHEPVKGVERSPNIECRVQEVSDEADLYREGDAFIMPRRYAGQCLPANEAQAAGLPLVCLDRNPDRDWTLSTARVPSFVKTSWQVRRRSIRDIKGSGEKGVSPVDVYDAKVSDVMEVISHVSQEPATCESLSNFSRARAMSMSWQMIGDNWHRLLAGNLPR